MDPATQLIYRAQPSETLAVIVMAAEETPNVETFPVFAEHVEFCRAILNRRALADANPIR